MGTVQACLFEKCRVPHVEGAAVLSTCGRYRWWLQRSWEGGDGRSVCFVMLNPSTADADTDDPTVRRCTAFAKAWGYSTLIVRNLFAFRATHPKQLARLPFEIATGCQQGNDELHPALSAHVTVCAWGACNVPGVAERAEWFIRQYQGLPLHCLGLTKAGRPRHPLYVRGDQKLIPFLP